MAHLGFNAAAIEPDLGPSKGILPKGKYVVICEKSEVKQTKKGTGHILALTFVVQEGEYTKRKIFDNINIQNENPVAQRIGQQHLAAFCHAVGIAQLDNSYQLHGIPVEVEVGIQPAKDGWEEKNVIKGFIQKAEITNAQGINLSQMAPLSPKPAADRAQIGGNLADLDSDIPF
jgi:hypothetical protein